MLSWGEARSQKPEARIWIPMQKPELRLFPSGFHILTFLIVHVLQAVFRIRERVFLGDLNGLVDFPVDPLLQILDAGGGNDAALFEEAFELVDGITLFPE